MNNNPMSLKCKTYYYANAKLRSQLWILVSNIAAEVRASELTELDHHLFEQAGGHKDGASDHRRSLRQLSNTAKVLQAQEEADDEVHLGIPDEDEADEEFATRDDCTPSPCETKITQLEVALIVDDNVCWI